MANTDEDYVKQLKSQDFDVVMQRLMGPKKQRSQRYIETWTMIKDTRPKEELMVQAAFESCAFKSALSCVAGMSAQPSFCNLYRQLMEIFVHF